MKFTRSDSLLDHFKRKHAAPKRKSETIPPAIIPTTQFCTVFKAKVVVDDQQPGCSKKLNITNSNNAELENVTACSEEVVMTKAQRRFGK